MRSVEVIRQRLVGDLLSSTRQEIGAEEFECERFKGVIGRVRIDEAEQAPDEEQRNLVLQQQHVEPDIVLGPRGAKDGILRVDRQSFLLHLLPALPVVYSDEELDHEAGVEQHHLDEVSAVHFKLLGVGAAHSVLHGLDVVEVVFQAHVGVPVEEMVEVVPFLLVHGLQARLAAVVGAEGDDVGLEGVGIGLPDDLRDSEDGGLLRAPPRLPLLVCLLRGVHPSSHIHLIQKQQHILL